MTDCLQCGTFCYKNNDNQKTKGTHKLEIYQLRTFVTVAQRSHLTQAAELLHLSQPAVTAQIKALEEDFGMPLFERSTGGVTLTRVGQELLPQAQAILTAARDLMNHSRMLKGEMKGKALIGTITTPEMTNIGPWVAALAEKYPLIDIQLQHGVTGQILNKVHQKRIRCWFLYWKQPLCQCQHPHTDRIMFPHRCACRLAITH